MRHRLPVGFVFLRRLLPFSPMMKAVPALVASLVSAVAPVYSAEAVSVDWLGGEPPAAAVGISWGVPWPRGAVKPGERFTLRGPAGESLAVQSWPLAYWPDGSLKWVGFATVAGPGKVGPYQLAPGVADAPAGPVLRVRRSDTGVEVDTGVMRLRVTNWGGDLIDSISVGGGALARGGRSGDHAGGEPVLGRGSALRRSRRGGGKPREPGAAGARQ